MGKLGWHSVKDVLSTFWLNWGAILSVSVICNNICLTVGDNAALIGIDLGQHIGKDIIYWVYLAHFGSFVVFTAFVCVLFADLLINYSVLMNPQDN